MITWNGKLNWTFEEKAQLRKDELKLKMIWRSEDGNKKSSEIALQETHRELESQRLEQHQANQCADQAQRERRLIYVENWKWGIDFVKKVKREQAMNLKNYREFATKRQIKSDNWRMKNCLYDKRGILLLWVCCWLRFRIYRSRWISCQMQENFTILTQRAALEHPTFPVNPWQFRVPEECPATILDCRLLHGVQWVLQETFLKAYLLEKDRRHLSSNIRGIWHHLLADWGLKLQEKHWDGEREVKREPQNSPIPVPRFQRGARVLDHTGGTYSHDGEIDYPRFLLGNASGEIPRLFGISKLEGQLQDWSLLKDSRSWSHNARDQRGWDSKVHRGINDIAVECGENRLSRLRCGWCDDCVCIEEASRQACALPREIKSRRATRSKIRPIFTEEAYCLYDLRTSIFVQPDLMKLCRDCEICSIYVYRTMTSRISMKDGIKLFCQQAKHPQERSWKIVQVKIAGFCSASDSIVFVCPRNCSIEGICMTSNGSVDENSKLQSLEWNCAKRSSNQESKR